MQLRSGEPDTPPLDLHLDDAELADLVRVLDQLRLDPRLQLALDLPEPRPLKAFELERRTPLRQRLAAPMGGLMALALLAGLGLLLPVPKPQPGGTPGAAKTSAPPTSLPLEPANRGS